jgi:NADH-quinone oxidoreductase subunit L
MEDLFAFQYSYLIPLLPLLGAALSGFFGARYLKQYSHWPIWLSIGIGAVLSFMLLFGAIGLMGQTPADLPAVQAADGGGQSIQTRDVAELQRWFAGISGTLHLFRWIEAGPFIVDAALFIDPLTIVMLCVVTGIGFFIAVFSRGYMAGEAGYFRFFSYIGLFIFSMICVIMGENLIALYLGWEAVGLCSYLLIGYYYERPAAREAAKKAFLVNRVGDLGFALGIMLTFYIFGTVSYYGAGAGTSTGILEMALTPQLVEGMTPFKQSLIPWIPFLLLTGALGKSAQFPLFVWLPDAMEGPTPVSALIHAATMVTSGIYMIARCSTLFFPVPSVMILIAVIGAFTAIFAATIAIRQFDLKKVFAYSTVSQLGFMFVGVATLAPVAGMFHLVTHAFFKATLFLSSGVVMHAMAGELDLRKMSGLKRQLPVTRWCMLAGCLALAGIIPFSGFWSKDEIIISAYQGATGGWIIGMVMSFTALLTAYYAFRVYFRVFEGPELIPTAPADQHAAPGVEPHAFASAVAVQTGDIESSGVDEHLVRRTPAGAGPADTRSAQPPAGDPAHGLAHGHAHVPGHGDDGHHGSHEPASMSIPLVVLAVGAVLAGVLNVPGHWFADFLGYSPSFRLGHFYAETVYGWGRVDHAMFGQHSGEAAVQGHTAIMVASILISLLGVLLAYMLHLQDRRRAEGAAMRFRPIMRVLEARYWVDEIYQAGIVEPLRSLGRALFAFDRMVIDGVIWAIGFVPQVSGFALKLSVQRGYLQGYALAMLLGIAVILLIVFL